MPAKRYRPEEIISKLREAEILFGQGKTVSQAIKVVLKNGVYLGLWVEPNLH